MNQRDGMLVCAAALIGVVVISAGAAPRSARETTQHPLDGLTAREYRAAVETLEKAGHTDESSRYPLIVLDEPDTDEVLGWKAGVTLPRRAFVIVMNASQTFEGIVDTSARKVVSWKRVPGVQPGILLTEEWDQAQRIVLANRDWQAAVRKRGIEDLREVVCIPHTVGYHGIAKEEGHRLVKVLCYDSRGIENFWGRPIEGLIAVVDQDERKLIEIIDTGVVPIPDAPVGFDEASVGELRRPTLPISIQQPEGPSFEIKGHQVAWQKWRFHVRIDPRLGLVISRVRYEDRGRTRSILYQGSLSEIFVPYMDPGAGWFFRTYMDAGEYGIGKLATSLQPGLDCPPNAVFFDAVFAEEWGHPYPVQRAACVFERYAGDIAWRHFEAENGRTEVRKRTELVLRLIAVVGNYDYIMDWVFRQDGTIRVAVGLSGVEQVKAVKSRTLADDPSGRDTAYGRMVAEHTVATHHDHYFSFRLDLDVDGRRNGIVFDRLKTKPLGTGSTRESIWVIEPEAPPTELAAKRRISLEKPAIWRVVNRTSIGPLGYPASYQLKPGPNAVPLLRPDDRVQKRAGFTGSHLWVTPYVPRERYAAGMYPNQSKGDDGLPAWTRADRPVQNTDIVLWYTLGFHHVVRAEDWPVLPTVWHEFQLRPFDFFPRNPALDLPE